MKNQKLFTVAALSLLMAGAVQAQEDTRDALSSYTFIEAQGGMQLTSTNAKIDKLMTPTAALSIGRYFSPVMGARLHINAWQAKGGFSDIDKYYKWKYVTPSVDLLINLTNLLSKSVDGSHPLNLILLGGVGLTYAWDNDNLTDSDLATHRTPMAWKDNRLGHNLRVGARLETDVTKLLGLSLEVNANSKDDRFNSKVNGSDDWQFTAMLGLSIRLGHKYKKVVPFTAPVVQEVVEQQAVEVAPAPVVVKEKVKKEVVKEVPMKMHKEVFYGIRVSENETPHAIMEQVAKFIKEKKNAKITIVGYADKGTGTPRVNAKYAAKRAENFKNDLVSKYGIDASIISTDSKGDTVQPFAENDKNRCVIIDAEGIQVTKEIIEVEE